MAGIMGDASASGSPRRSSGISQRLLVYRVGPDAPVIALANPELEWTSGDEEVREEGCLSIPGITVDVERPVHVRVRALDEEGETRMVEASGLEARVIQHEMDHLDGVLILDRTTRDERKRALRELREAERAKRARRKRLSAGLPAQLLEVQQLFVGRQRQELHEVVAQRHALEQRARQVGAALLLEPLVVADLLADLLQLLGRPARAPGRA